MDKIKKFLERLNPKERARIDATAEKIINGLFLGLDIKKLTNTNLSRVRIGRFRIIFHFNTETQEFVIDDILLRNENTYK